MAHKRKPIKNLVGTEIRRLRESHGWSQAEFAAKCQISGWDISRGIVAAIEGRVRWVGDFELVLLAKVLKTPVASLIPDDIDWKQIDVGHALRR